MLKLISGLFILLVLAAQTVSAGWEGPQKASMSYFPHKLHQKNLGGCSDCHGEKGPGPIVQFGEKWAHDTCTECHKKKHTGPVECSGCHTQF